MVESKDERYLLAEERTELATERNRLANERTYLAWTRTGLASVGAGFAIIRFLTFQNISHQVLSQTIGCILVALGVIIFGLSFLDYKKSYDRLKVKNGYAGSVWSICTITITLIAVSLIMLLIAFKIH